LSIAGCFIMDCGFFTPLCRFFTRKSPTSVRFFEILRKALFLIIFFLKIKKSSVRNRNFFSRHLAEGFSKFSEFVRNFSDFLLKIWFIFHRDFYKFWSRGFFSSLVIPDKSHLESLWKWKKKVIWRLIFGFHWKLFWFFSLH